MRDKIREILAEFHDTIIGIWELGQQNEDNYHDKITKIILNTLNTILALVEKENIKYKQLVSLLSYYKDDLNKIKQLTQENKRYKEALEEIKNLTHPREWCWDIVSQALGKEE